jgi:hypothetical protein
VAPLDEPRGAARAREVLGVRGQLLAQQREVVIRTEIVAKLMQTTWQLEPESDD